ncbi:hypothetical protein GCM10027184_64860 [Saccharothrix stipae]
MADMARRRGPAFDRVVGAAGGATVGILAALALGPEAAGIVGNSSGPLIEELSYGVRQLLMRQIGRVEAATEEAVTCGNCTIDELLRESLADDRRAAVMTAALRAAAVAQDEATVLALGRAYARGVLTADDAQIDEQMRIVATLGTLDPVDVRVLHVMREGEWAKRPSKGSSLGFLSEEIPSVLSVVDAVVARLLTEGLISNEAPGMMAGTRLQITDFGRLCLRSLWEVGYQASDNAVQ